MSNLVKDILTEDNGTSYCFARVASSIGIISYLIDASFIIYKSGGIDLVQFATGFGIILAASGAAIAAKAATQKEQPPQKSE